MRIRGTKDVVM